jgi:HSP20 family protein
MSYRNYRDLFRHMENDLQRLAEEAFVGFFDPPSGVSRFWQPAADVHETDAGVVIKMELAGVAAENLNVSLGADGRTLTVSGVRAERQDERHDRTCCHQLEIYFGPFERAFALPQNLDVERDAISATLRDGFLTIALPRRERQAAPSRSIPIDVHK